MKGTKYILHPTLSLREAMSIGYRPSYDRREIRKTGRRCLAEFGGVVGCENDLDGTVAKCGNAGMYADLKYRDAACKEVEAVQKTRPWRVRDSHEGVGAAARLEKGSEPGVDAPMAAEWRRLRVSESNTSPVRRQGRAAPGSEEGDCSDELIYSLRRRR